MSQLQALDLIQSLGFSSYEAKAYLGLLSCQPATGYELAKQSGVPSSKIYEILNKLLDRGVVQKTQALGEETERYLALKPEDFSNQINEATLSRTRKLLPLLEELGDPKQADYIWPISQASAVEAKANELIQNAQKSVLVSGWPSELLTIEAPLKAAEQRGLKIAMVHFGKTDLKIGATYYHPEEKTLYQEKGGRGFTLVVDGEVVVMANFLAKGNVDAAWSRNQAFVTVAEDYVKHDVYITKVTRFLNAEMRARFGENYEHLRNVFNSEA